MSLSIILIPLLAGIISQLIKVIIDLSKKKKVTLVSLISYGGMPSSHAAMTVSLVLAAYWLEGLNSFAFAISLILYIIVVRDAVGYRRELGKHAKLLNTLREKHQMQLPRFTERLGHTSTEAFVGSVLGIIISLAVLLLL